MDTSRTTALSPPDRIGLVEFVTLMAMMFATTAFSIDALLPAMPQIALDISPLNPTRAAWVLTAFVGGLGFGTFFAGPLSDAWGRKTVIYVGGTIYILSAIGAWLSQTLEVMLIARFVQGIGASGPRVVSLAIIRDLYEGRQMARIVSFTVMIFILVPAIAPALGALIIDLAGWRAVFGAFIGFSVLTMLWIMVRLREPLALENRRPIRLSLMRNALAEMGGNRTVVLSIAVQTLVMSMLFATLTMIQPIYEQTYGRADSFPMWFGIVALLSGGASLLNAMIVTRFGMRKVVTWTIATQVSCSVVLLALLWQDSSHMFGLFLVWQFCLLSQAGLTVGNLNAIGMEPMGHIAGMAASVIGSVATVMAAIIASPLGLLFDGTPRPLIASVIVLGLLSIILMAAMNRGEDRKI